MSSDDKSGLILLIFVVLCIGWSAYDWAQRDDCPSCGKWNIRPEPYHSLEDSTTRWKCPRCWYPVREEKLSD